MELSQGDVSVQVRLKPAGSIRASFRDAAQAERVLLHAFVRGADQWPIEGRRQDGEVWFQDLPLGRYEVFAGQPVPDAVQRVDLTADGQVAQVQLPVASLQSIAGTVRDERGVPVVEAWVRALTAPQVMKVAIEAARPVLTDAQGAFWLDGLTPGQYEIVCTSGAGEGRAQQVSAGVLDVRVAFSTYGSLSGTVETASGSPPPAFELEYARKNGPPGRVSGLDGRWSLPWLAPGEYDLHVRSDAGEAHQSVVLAPGGNVLVRSRLDVTR
ncbi:MAG: carboxypeptidase-like regulatory domain-containing protein [Deltaproteobacteria bacterium]